MQVLVSPDNQTHWDPHLPRYENGSPTVKKSDFRTIAPDFLDQVSLMPQRPWLIPNHLLVGYLTCVLSPGGVGKSSFELATAISVAIGRNLLGTTDYIRQRNCVVINNEDDNDEVQRRLAGMLTKHDIEASDVAGRLFFYSGYGNPLTIAHQDEHTGAVVASPNMHTFTDFIRENDIGAVFIDPFISTHDQPENGNTEVDKVVQQYKRIANATGVAISLAHHVRKGSPDSEGHAGDAESGRGASSLKDACRCVLTLSRMNERTADTLGFDSRERERHVRLDVGKLNFGLSDGKAKWFRMESVYLGNGDAVGVPVPVNLEPMFDQAKRGASNTKWTTHTVAEALERLIPDGTSCVQWTDIRTQFMDENDVRKTQAADLIANLSKDPKRPTRIKVEGKLIDYWIEKSHQTAPWVIHRTELN